MTNHYTTTARLGAATCLDDRPDLTTIEHLDFEHGLECEHSQHRPGGGSHRGAAAVLVDIHCPHCSQSARIAFCMQWWDHTGMHGMRCIVCKVPVSRDDMYRVVRWLS